MLNNRKILVGIIYMLSSCTITFSEERELPKFGKIDQQEMNINVCPIDSNSSAFVIFDKGKTEFVYIKNKIGMGDMFLTNLSIKGFQMKYTRHIRIKILDKVVSCLTYFEIPLYQSETNREQLFGLKAYTYNQLNGKIKKTKLKPKQVISEKKDKNWTIHKFTMPDVQDGSVIEVTYQILSDFHYNIQGWKFQSDIPVLYSEYTVSIPEYFTYIPRIYGDYSINRKQSIVKQSTTFTMQFKDGSTLNKSVSYQDNVTKYYVSNLPAFKENEFLINSQLSIKFELAGYQFPKLSSKIDFKIEKSNAKNWESFNKANVSIQQLNTLDSLARDFSKIRMERYYSMFVAAIKNNPVHYVLNLIPKDEQTLQVDTGKLSAL
jgi:hypothetical protein